MKHEPISREEEDMYKGYMLVFLGREYHKYGWVQQYHIGALRNNSKSMLKQIGPDTGFDAIEDAVYMENYRLYSVHWMKPTNCRKRFCTV